MLCNTKTGTQGTRCKYAAVENFQFLSIRQISIKSVDFNNNCSQKRYKNTEIRSKNVFDLENLCTIMEEWSKMYITIFSIIIKEEDG